MYIYPKDLAGNTKHCGCLIRKATFFKFNNLSFYECILSIFKYDFNLENSTIYLACISIHIVTYCTV